MSARSSLDLADQGHPVLYLSVEEGTGPTAIERFRQVRTLMGIAPPRNLLVADVVTAEEALIEVNRFREAHDTGFVVVDSLTDLRAAPGFATDLIADDRFGCILVLHLTTAGVPRGGLEPVYAADVWLHVRDLEAHIRKSRWGAGSSFRIDGPHSAGVDEPGNVLPYPKETP